MQTIEVFLLKLRKKLTGKILNFPRGIRKVGVKPLQILVNLAVCTSI